MKEAFGSGPLTPSNLHNRQTFKELAQTHIWWYVQQFISEKLDK